jgi:uncharacterized integral membrane protein
VFKILRSIEQFSILRNTLKIKKDIPKSYPFCFLFDLFPHWLLATFAVENTNRMSWKVIVFLILAALLVIFTVQNQILLNIKFFHWEITDVPVAYVLLFGLIFGFLLAMMMQIPTILKLRRELRKVVREIEDSEKIEPAKEEVGGSEDVSMGNDYKGGFFNE